MFLILFTCLILSSLGNILAETPLCSENCVANETYTRCSPGQNQATCWKKPSDQDLSSCSPGCVCAEGFIRDPNTYLCIPLNNCPRKSRGNREACPRYERWSACGFGCDETCGFLSRDLICRSCIPGCICDTDYVRSTITGQCLKRVDCKRESIRDCFMISIMF